MSARMYGGLSSDERRADRRSRLLEAGFELFGTAGYPAVSIPDICSRSGVTARHFYDEFASREALLKAIYDDLGAVLLYRVRRALFGEHRGPRSVVRAGCAAYAEYLTSDPRRARVFCVEAAGISRDLDHHRVLVRRRFAELSLESTQRLRAVAFDPGVDFGVLSTLLTGAADALMTEWVLTREPSVATLIDTLTTVWMRSLQLDDLEALIAAGGVVPDSLAAQAVAAPRPAVDWPSLGLEDPPPKRAPRKRRPAR
jgi:AcrR family transcriptional regulator